MFVLKLQKLINGKNNEEDIFVNIAHYLLKRIRKDNSKLFIEDIAHDCFTSAGSVSRFVRHLGYNSFLEFKNAYLATSLELDEMIIDLQVKNKPGLIAKETTEKQVKRIIASLEGMINNFDYHEIKNLTQMIDEANNVNIFATHIPGNISEIFQHELLVAGKHCLYYPTHEAQLKQADDLAKGDLAFVASLDGSFVMDKELTIKIVKSSAKSVLLTQNPTMKFSESFDYIVSLGSKDHESVGKYKLLLFYELLAKNYYQNYL
ncbi:MAG: MurR/RpiR family transcriptional regulator [Erysipelotrichaceae bacterium]